MYEQRQNLTKMESIEAIRERARGELKRAQGHALDIETDDAVLQEYADLCMQNLLPESQKPNSFNKERLDALEKIILNATAQAKNITEFRLFLEEAGLPTNLIDEFVAHENAHANTVEQHPESIEFRGYGLTYFKEGNTLASVQPCILEKKRGVAETIDYIVDKIKALEAPDVYGEETSQDDKREIEALKEMRQSQFKK